MADSNENVAVPAEIKVLSTLCFLAKKEYSFATVMSLCCPTNHFWACINQVPPFMAKNGQSDVLVTGIL